MQRARVTGQQPALCRIALLGMVLVGAPGCGSDDDDGDDGDDDGAVDAGAADGGRDAVTPCGPEAECDRASEICVRSDFDTGQTHECVPLPDGCGSMRTCGDCAAVCDEPAESCTETDEDNVLACPCLVCG